MGSLIWITGLSGAGKTTIANNLYQKLKSRLPNTVLLDGDIFREVIGAEIAGYDKKGRLQNAMRIARMCKFLTDQKINVICSTMSLFKECHDFNRTHIQQYFEVYIEVSMDELIKRDQKGIYTKAIASGEESVVGINMLFDKPEEPDLVIHNNDHQISINDKTKLIIDAVEKKYALQ